MVWVARTLFKNGRVFLVDVFRGNEALADSVNHLLVIGFYLINLGYIKPRAQTRLRGSEDARDDGGSVVEGRGLLVLGFMHLFNLFALGRIRRFTNKVRGRRKQPGASGLV
ncbi:MAG: hypothetical protein H0X71_02315 [Rubrobacter sp.]|nr:hypothetical protein [Rubrobacter sp.]